jgi:hypothetical protein
MNFNSLYNKLELIEEARQSSVWLPGWQNMLVNTRKFQEKLRAEGIKFPTPINALAKYALVTIDGVTSGKIDSDGSKSEVENELSDQVDQAKESGLPYTILIKKLNSITDPTIKDEINKVWTTSITAENPIEMWAMREISHSNRKMDSGSFKEKLSYLKGIISDVFKGGDVEAVQKAKEAQIQAKKDVKIDNETRLDTDLIDKAELGIETAFEDALSDKEVWERDLLPKVEEEVIKYVEKLEDKLQGAPNNLKQLKYLNNLRIMIIKALGEANSYIHFKDLLDSSNNPIFGTTDTKNTALYSIWNKIVLPVVENYFKFSTADISKAPQPKAKPTRSGVDMGGYGMGSIAPDDSARRIANPFEDEEEPVTESTKPKIEFISNKDRFKPKTFWQRVAQEELYYR